MIGSKRTEPHGLIRIASSLSFGQSYLAEAMRRYAALHPSVSVEMVLKDQSVNLVEQRLDLAIQVGDNQVGDKLEPGVISRQLSRCTSVVLPLPITWHAGVFPSGRKH